MAVKAALCVSRGLDDEDESVRDARIVKNLPLGDSACFSAKRGSYIQHRK